MGRKEKVLIREAGKPCIVQAQVCGRTVEKNPDTGRHVMCGYIRRGGKHIRVYLVDASPSRYTMFVSTWDYPANGLQRAIAAVIAARSGTQ